MRRGIHNIMRLFDVKLTNGVLEALSCHTYNSAGVKQTTSHHAGMDEVLHKEIHRGGYSDALPRYIPRSWLRASTTGTLILNKAPLLGNHGASQRSCPIKHTQHAPWYGPGTATTRRFAEAVSLHNTALRTALEADLISVAPPVR